MPATPSPRPEREDDVLAGYPPAPAVAAGDVAAAVAASGRRLVVFDDDPTGTQTVAGVPVLTTWEVDDLRWGLRQGSPAFYILTNTRSLSPTDAARRNREVTSALVAASKAEGIGYTVVSRSDSTLRGHFPLETDVVAEVLAEEAGLAIDGLVIVPAYVEGGRVTVDSVHRLRSGEQLVPVGESEFARDATFGYRSSDLRQWVEEKTSGRWKAGEVARLTLRELRGGGVGAVSAVLGQLTGARPVVVDAVTDDDLRLLSLALLEAEAAGKTFLYRVGPSFVRARAGLGAEPPLTAEAVDAVRLGGGERSPRPGAQEPAGAERGLVVVGSHVAQTTRQLERLRRLEGTAEVVVDVHELLEEGASGEVVRRAAQAVVAALEGHDVVVSTSRQVVTGPDAEASLAIARAVSAALVDLVRAVVARRVPRWVVAKGGITSSDLATEALGIRRAWVRGTLLPGIVSLWDPETATAPGMAHVPYVVFAGNVGGDEALVEVVDTLRGGR